MRFRKKESLRVWFLKKAGNETAPFSFPESFKKFNKTLIFLPDSKEEVVAFLENFKCFWNKENSLFIARDSLRETLIHHPLTKALFLTEKEFRFGEQVFIDVESQIKAFNPDSCIYLAKSFLPALYLAMGSKAPCRIGFCSDSLYPFLNISLQAHSFSDKIALLLKQYRGSNANS